MAYLNRLTSLWCSLTLVVTTYYAGAVRQLHAEVLAPTTTIKLEVRERNRWKQLTLTGLRMLVKPLINCSCESAHSLLAIGGEAVVGEQRVQLVLYGGESTAATLVQCPSRVPVSAEFGPLKLSGLFEGRPTKVDGFDVVVYSGVLFEVGRTQNNSDTRLTVSNMPGEPTSFCFSQAAHREASRNSSQSSETAALGGGDPKTSTTWQFYSEVESALAQREIIDWYDPRKRLDPLGRLIPAAQSTSKIHHFAVAAPPCLPGWFKSNPFYQGPNCDGTVTVPLNLGPLTLIHRPRSGLPEISFLGMIGVRHQFSWMLRTTNQPAAGSMFTDLWTPTGEVIALKRSSGSEHTAVNPAWDISGQLRVYFEGTNSLTASAILEGHRIVFRRAKADERIFHLESIASPSGEFLVRFFGPTPSNPTFLEMKDDAGDYVTYKFARADSKIQMLETKRVSQTEKLMKPASLVSELWLKRGFPEVILDRGRASTIRSDRALNGETLILGVYSGEERGPVESAREYGYDAVGSVLSMYSTAGAGSRRAVSYTGNTIKITDLQTGQIEQYAFSEVNGETLLSRQDGSGTSLRYTYDPDKWNALKELHDERFALPLFSLQALSQNVISWTRLGQSYTLNSTRSSGEQSTELIERPPNQNPPSVRTLAEKDGKSTRSLRQGALEIEETTSSDSLSRTMKINGTVALAQEVSGRVELGPGEEQREVVYHDRMRDIQIASNSRYTPQDATEDVRISIAQGLLATFSKRLTTGRDLSVTFSQKTTEVGDKMRAFFASIKGSGVSSETLTSVPGAWSLLKTSRRATSSENGASIVEERNEWEGVP